MIKVFYITNSTGKNDSDDTKILTKEQTSANRSAWKIQLFIAILGAVSYVVI
jgi:hypothetical protein